MGMTFNIEISEEELLITPIMNALNKFRNDVKLGVKMNVSFYYNLYKILGQIYYLKRIVICKNLSKRIRNYYKG